MDVFGRCRRSRLEFEVQQFTFMLRLGWRKIKTRLSFWLNLIYASRTPAGSKPMSSFGPRKMLPWLIINLARTDIGGYPPGQIVFPVKPAVSLHHLQARQHRLLSSSPTSCSASWPCTSST
jgi:hypothetical protein